MNADPLKSFGPHGMRELFERFSRAADGFPTEAAIGAAANVLLNAMRQAHPTRERAEVAFDAMFGQLKALLLEQHYDSFGRRKGLFPYTQTIDVDYFDARTRKK